jgi:hypothetical protein
LKILGFSVLFAAVAVVMAVIIVMFTSTPVVYHSHKTFVKTGKMECVFVLTNKGQESCSVLEKEKITRYESDWAE